MLVEALIGDLLLRHNCVVVPAFGGFVAKQTAATIDYANGTMLPPRKSLLFNRQLINNDGLIIAAFAQENAISYNEAQAELSAVIAQWQRKLHQGERVTLDKVGHLFLDQEKNIGFEQDRHFNLLLEAYGLGKVHFISEEDIQLVAAEAVKIAPVETTIEAPILEMKPIGEPILKTEKTAEIQSTQHKPIRLWRYAAAVALIPIAFYSFWIPMKTDVLESGIISSADFNPFHKISARKYQPKNWSFTYKNPKIEFESVEEMANSISTDVRVLSYPFDENVFIAVRLRDEASEIQAKAVVINENENNPTEQSKPQTQKTSGNYRFIVGFFSTEKNATNLARVLSSKGLSPEILSYNGGFRVSAARSAEMDFSKVGPVLSELKLTGWVLTSN
jgi:hypothetical protein